MSAKSTDRADTGAPRVDRARLRKGPTAADLRAIPETTRADWLEAELLVAIDKGTYQEFEMFRARWRQKKAAKAARRS